MANFIPSNKTRGIEKSIWVEIGDLAREVNPVNLGTGFPDCLPPDTIRASLANVVSDDTIPLVHQYSRSFGHERFVNALAKLYSKLMMREVDPMTEILATTGATHSLFVIMMGLLNAGDEVIIIEPFYDAYFPQVQLAGGVPVFVSLKPSKIGGVTSSADWILDAEELASAFTDKTKLIIVNTPNNPLGKVYSREELELIARLCKQHDVVAVMDEVYEWLVYDGREHIRMATLPDMWERTITVGSGGKTFSVTGWRIGWAIGPKQLLCGPNMVHQHAIYVAATPIQEAIAIGFELELERFGRPDCYFLSLPAELELKRNRVIKMLTQVGLSPIVPEGGYFVLADVRSIMNRIDVGGDPSEPKDLRFVKWLSRNRKLQGVPPSFFFSDKHKEIGENYIRFCFIKDDAKLDKAGEILHQLKHDLDNNKILTA